MAKKQTPHLDKWKSTFRGKSGKIREAVKGTIGEVMPETTSMVQSASSLARETRQYATKTKSQITGKLRRVNRQSSDIMKDAFHDMQTGNYSLNKFADSIYDSTDDIDSMVNDMDKSSPDMGGVQQSAIVGKAVVEGNAATIQGIQQMTSTLSSVNLKATNAMMATIRDMGILQMNQTNSVLERMSQQIRSVDSRLDAIVRFNNESILPTQRAMLEFYHEMDEKFYNIGMVLSDMKDFMEQTRETSKKSRDTHDPYDFRGGFDFGKYKNMVKHNFRNSMYGSMFELGKTGLGLASGMGMDPATLVMSQLMGAAIPKSLKKSLSRTDKMLTAGIDEMLYNLGDLANGRGMKAFFGELFGKKRPSFKSANLGDYKKDYMGWNGVAQRYLTEVIPSYLASIESALTKKDTRFYDADKGLFMTDSQIRKSFQTEVSDNIEWKMREFTDTLGKKMGNNVSDEKLDEIQKTISDLVNNRVLNRSTTTTQDDIRSIRNTLRRDGKLSENDLRDVMMEFTSGLHEAQKSVNEFVSSMENDLSGAVYRNLHNTYGKDTSDLYRGSDIFQGTLFSSNGIRFENLSSSEKRKFENEKKRKSFVKDILNKIRKDRSKEHGRVSHFVDDRTDDLYDILTGNYERGSRRGNAGATSSQSTSSRFNSPVVNSSTNRKLNQAIDSLTKDRFDNTMNRTSSQILNQSKRTDDLMKDLNEDSTSLAILHPSGNRKGAATSQADPHASSAQLQAVNSQVENTNILKRLVLSLHTNFLQPLVGGLFGKDGFFRNIFNEERMKKWKEKLFDEKNGIFGNFTSYMKDSFDYMKYVFTGKKYTNRQGKTYPENENSVLDHLSGGWDFLYRNTMKYLFGDDYESNDTFKKYFQWLDWKGKRQKKREARLAKENSDSAKGTNAEDIQKESNDELRRIDGGNQLLLEDNASQKIKSHIKRTSERLALPGQTSDSAKFEVMTPEDASLIREQISTNMVVASQDAAALILQSGQNMSNALVGDFADEKTLDSATEKANKSFIDNFKKALPRSLAFATAGAAVGTYTGLHGAGLIGSMFLPGGPISGALLGIGLSLATKSEGLMKFIFGDKDDDGKRMGGLISKRSQEWMKKSMPIIAGGAMVGAAKSLIFGGLGNGLANAPGGFILQSLLPGGVIGGAMLGLGVSLFKNNEKVREILFGKDNGDGKKIGGLLNKNSSKLGKVLSKSGDFIKGGLKGLGIGLIANSTLSGAGVIGAALTAGGPIGLGLTGLGLGIAAQTKRFKEVLFGTEEFDENGNFIGRKQDGLLTRARNMLVVNVFEPIKESIQNKAVEFAFWAKEKIEYPFRLAFGPIIDSFKGIKQNIEDSIHDMFNNIGMTITDALKAGFKKLFSPFTKVLKFAANGLSKGLTLSLKAALTPITVPLKMLQFATAGRRFRENQQRRGTQLEHFGDIITNAKENWANEDAEEKGYTGPFAGIKRFVGHTKDLKQGWDASTAAYNKEMAEQGFNSLNWRNVAQEKRDLKKKKAAWKNEYSNQKKMRKLRNAILEDHKWASDTEFTEDAIADIQKKGAKLGIDREWLSTSEDINQFLTHHNDWLDKWNPNSDKTSAEYQAKHGMLIRETPEQAKARHDTKAYQEAVLEKFSGVEKAFTKYAAQDALKRRSNLSPSEINEITKDLKSKGLSWDDVGFDPADLADAGQIGNEDWDDLMRGLYEDGDITSYKKWYRKKFVENVDAEEFSPEEAKFESSNGSKEMDGFRAQQDKFWNTPSHHGEVIDFDEDGNVIVEDGLDELKGALDLQVDILMGIKAATEETAGNTEEANINDAQRAILADKNARKKARHDKEADESKKAKGLGILSGSKDTDDKDSATIDLDEEMSDEDEEETKSGIGGFFKSAFGSLSSWLLSSTVWTKVGIGTVIMGLFGDQIITIASALTGFIQEHVWPHVSKLLGTVWTGLQRNVPVLLEKLHMFITENMPQIINTAVHTAWTAVSTLGKMAINALADFLPVDVPTPFPEVEIGKHREGGQTTYNSKETADAAGLDLNADNIQINPDGTVTGITEGYGYDSEGNLVNARSGGTGYGVGELGKFGYKMTTSKFTRTAMKKAGKASLTAAGWVTGIIPGGKLIKATAGGVKHTAKGLHSVGKAIKNKGEDLLERGAKKAAKETVEKGADAATKKGLLKWVKDKIMSIDKVAGFVEKHMPKGSFMKCIREAIQGLLTKISSAGVPLISKASNWLMKKLGYTGAKAALGVVPVLNFVLAGVDFIRGIVGADELFGVDDPTPPMKIVSGILESLLGTSAGVVVDLLFSLAAFFGYNIKRKIARGLYNILTGGGSEHAFELADAKIELEAKKYNKANNTSLSGDEYRELKNKTTGMLWWKKKVMSDEERKKYEVSDKEAERYLKGESAPSAEIDTDGTTAPTSKEVSQYQGQDLLYGSRRGKKFSGRYHSKALSYGDAYGGALTQGDPRWGSFELGKFADGTISTMATGGCGPTALSMVANSLGGRKSPLEVAKYAKTSGFIRDGGSTSGLFTSGANAMGLSSTSVGKNSLEEQLSSGSPMIIAGKSKSSASPYTDAGHVVVANGLDRSGNVVVNNPMDQEVQHVPMNEVKSGMTHAWKYSTGGGNATGYGRGPLGFGQAFISADPNGHTIWDSYEDFNSIWGDFEKYKKGTLSNASDITNLLNTEYSAGGVFANDLRNLEITKADIYAGLVSAEREYIRKNGIDIMKKLDGNSSIKAALSRDEDSGIIYQAFKRLYSSEDLYADARDAAIDDYYTFSDFCKKYLVPSLTRQQEESQTGADSIARWSDIDGSTIALYNILTDTIDHKFTLKDVLPLILNETLRGKFSENKDYAEFKRANIDVVSVKNWYKNAHAPGGDANTAEFYNGHTVGELKLMEKMYHLSTDASIPLFKTVYDHFVTNANGRYSDDTKITTQHIKDMLNASALKTTLGGDGEEVVSDQKFTYRNGMPFFYLEDERWNDLEWRGERIGTRGSDIASVAAIASAYGLKLNDPRVVHQWVQKFPKWGSVNKGISEGDIFRNGGFNALLSTQGDVEDDEGKVTGRLKIERLGTKESIHEALRNHIPVYLSGYRFPGSIFGGDHDISVRSPYSEDMTRQLEEYARIDPRHAPDVAAMMRDSSSMDIIKKNEKNKNKARKSDGYGAVVAVGANSTHVAVNNPHDRMGTQDIFDVNRIFATLDDGSSVVQNAWAIKGPNGKGLSGKVDMSRMEASTSSDHLVLADQKGIDNKITALLSNIGKVFWHQIDALAEGKKYKSIWEANDADMTEDDGGVGNDIDNAKIEELEAKDNETPNDPQEAGGVNDVNTQNQESDPPDSQFKNPQDAYTRNPNGIGTVKGIGSGFRDIPIAFGKKKKSKKNHKKGNTRPSILSQASGDTVTDKLINSLGAISYASQAQLAGQDYDAAKIEYFKQQQSSGGSNGTDSGAAGGQSYPIVAAPNANLSTFGQNDVLLTDLKDIPKVSPAQIKKTIKENWQKAGSVFKKGQEDNDARGIYLAQNDTNLSAIIPFAIGAQESGWGRSTIANEKGNLWGWGAVNSDPYNGAKSFNPNDMGASFGLYSKALLAKYYDEYGLHNIANIGSGGGKGNLAYAQDGHGHASTSWAANVSSTGFRNIKSMRKAKGEKTKGSSYTIDPQHTGEAAKNAADEEWYAQKYHGIGAIAFGKTQGMDWISVIKDVKAQIASHKKGYKLGGNVMKITSNGITTNYRTDCSGFVSICISCYTGKNVLLSSNDLVGGDLTSSGFTKISWPGWENLQAGDIMARPGHTEIFSHNDGSRHMVWNCGSHESCNSPNQTSSSKSSYTVVWRPGNAGSTANLFDTVTDSANANANDSSNNAGGLGVTPTSPFDVPLAKFAAQAKSTFDGGRMIENFKGPGNHKLVSSLGGSLTSGYGRRKTSLGNEFHRGIDIAAGRGTSIKSPISGHVVSTGNDIAGYGNYTMIQDRKGYNHLFAHMDGPSVYGLGSVVNSNDVIGEVGTSGKSTGSHLHYEIRRSGNKYSAIDPLSYNYDEVGKDLNIMNQMEVHSRDAIGGGERDIPVMGPGNVNVDLNADGIEARLDKLTAIMSQWAEKNAPEASKTFTQTTNTTNISYGPGQTKKVTKKSSSQGKPGEDEMAKSLALLHRDLAGK